MTMKDLKEHLHKDGEKHYEQFKLKAYHVQNTEGEYHEVVFAATPSQAKYASEAMSWCEWIEVRVKRVKEFDQYAELGYVPVQAMLDAGWWFECHKCFKPVSEEDKYAIKNERVYCEECSKELKL